MQLCKGCGLDLLRSPGRSHGSPPGRGPGRSHGSPAGRSPVRANIVQGLWFRLTEESWEPWEES